MIELASDDFLREPWAAYATWRKHGEVVRDDRTGMWLVLAYDAVKRALTDHGAFASTIAGGAPGKWLLFADPPRHTKLRALVSRAFTPRSVAGIEPRIRELARGLLDPLRRERGAIDLVERFTVPLPMMVIAELLGAPTADWSLFRGWSDAVLGLVTTLTGGAAAENAGRAFADASRVMRAYLDDLLAARRANVHDDLLGRLVAAQVDGDQLADDEIFAFFQLLLLAGHETTTNLLGNAVVLFAEWPSVFDAIRAEPPVLAATIEEVLRFRSPVQAMFRVAREEVELGGARIPAGSIVLAMIGAANRDAATFTDPDRFDAARTPNPHLAFGHGIHFCVGAPLARLEARVALEELAARARGFDLAGPWQPRKAFHVHGPAVLPVNVDWSDEALTST